MNSTPFVRQYDIISNKWGDLLCQTINIYLGSRNWLWRHAEMHFCCNKSSDVIKSIIRM